CSAVASVSCASSASRADKTCNATSRLTVSSFLDGGLSPSLFTYPLVACERCNQAQFLFCSGPRRRQKIAEPIQSGPVIGNRGERQANLMTRAELLLIRAFSGVGEVKLCRLIAA